MDNNKKMDGDELIKMLDSYMESGGSYFKAADGKIMTDASSGKSEGNADKAAETFTCGTGGCCPTCADIPNIMSSAPDNEDNK